MCWQLAPYNTQYERLSSHMASAGVAVDPNLLDRPVTLARAHAPATPDSEASMAPGLRPIAGSRELGHGLWDSSMSRVGGGGPR